jgi:hypothetical protein
MVGSRTHNSICDLKPSHGNNLLAGVLLPRKRDSVYELGMKSFPNGRRLGKLSLNPEHDAAMGVIRPETDLVPTESRSSLGVSGTENSTDPNRLIQVQSCL